MDPNELLKDPEQIKALISLLQGLVDQSSPKPDEEEEPENNRVAPSKPGSTIKTKGRQKAGANNTIKSKKLQSKNTNQFEKMAEFRMHKDDCAIDKKLCSNPPVARMRDFEFIDVVCRVCGKKESIAPALLFDVPSRYKCNNCSTQSG
jgi:hypothetical protein